MAGSIEPCQTGVFLTYASRFGQALIDCRLYLPEAWATDAPQRAKASVPAEITIATKPARARDLVAVALDTGAPCALCWPTRSLRLYGSDSQLRHMLEALERAYVPAVRSNHQLRFLDNWTPPSTSRFRRDCDSLLVIGGWRQNDAGPGWVLRH